MHPVVKIAIVAVPAAAVVIGLTVSKRYPQRAVTLSKRDSEHAVVDPKSIAVLPFENLSPDPDSAYFDIAVQEQCLA